jgi:hypothetical protein
MGHVFLGGVLVILLSQVGVTDGVWSCQTCLRLVYGVFFFILKNAVLEKCSGSCPNCPGAHLGGLVMFYFNGVGMNVWGID